MSKTPDQKLAAGAQTALTSFQRDNASADLIPLTPGDSVSQTDVIAYKNLITALSTLERSAAWQENAQITVQTVRGGVQAVQGGQGGQGGALGGGDTVATQESLHLNVTKGLVPKEDKVARPRKRPSTTLPTFTTSTKKKRKLTQAKLSDYFP